VKTLKSTAVLFQRDLGTMGAMRFCEMTPNRERSPIVNTEELCILKYVVSKYFH
jgi:hypothetical protein